MNHVTLYYREGSSDKVYQVSLEPSGDQFVVNFAFGRRGSTLQTGTKTSNPVDHETASRLFNQLVKEKQAKGYTPGQDGTPYAYTEQANQVAGIRPQLLNPIEAEEVARLVSDPEWCVQEKKDGRRLLLRRQGEKIASINRKGLLVGLPASLLQSARRVREDYLIDGECVGDRLHAFDLLSRGGTSLLAEPYHARLNQLTDLLDYSDHPDIELIETAFEAAEKQSFVEALRRDQREGVVFKRLDASYTPGRPSRGGSQLKYKFCATASFIVARLNDQRSVLLRLIDQAGTAGNVTIPPDQPVPQVGAVVEVRFLYAFRQSGCLYQPVYLGVREDTDPSECTADQLKYKSPDEPEAA